MADPTLLDIAKLNATDQVVGLIEENLTASPEVGFFPARQVKGTSFYTTKRTGFPTVGFRKANGGIVPSKSVFTRQLCELFLLGGPIEIDLMVSQAFDRGGAAFEMIESSGVMRNALITLGKQIWYGVSNDANGFPGIKSLVAAGSTISKDATGTTATTASSVYAVKFGIQNASIVTGNNATFELSPFRDQQLTDASDSTKRYPGRVADLAAWVGLSVQNVNCVGRIYNLTAEANKGLTDTQLAQLIAKFPVGFTPDRIFMSRRSRQQLQISRTVTLFGQGTSRPGGGQGLIAPIPTEYDGIPISATDSILDTDVIE